MTSILTIVGLIVVTFVVLGFIFARLYKKATKEVAFVRTGLGGEKVIKDGGAIVLPILHEIIPVNMKTLKLKVERKHEDALITKDRMRVDVEADFYVRVNPTKEGIAIAAQTLGNRTMNPVQLRELIEGKFIDALRNVAAQMNLNDLHENRAKFVSEVQNTLKEDLEKNGLELESVSLTNLDQTDIKYLKPENNAFDAEGAKVLTKIIQENKKIRNEIEKNTEVEIENKNLETKTKILEIEKQEKILEAEQKTAIEKEQAEKEKEAKIAKVIAEKEAEKAKIETEKEIKQKEIEKEKELENAKIQKEAEIQQKEIEKEKIVKEKAIETNIEIAKKIEEEAKAQAEANLAKAEEVKTEEEIKTAREKAAFERQKIIEIIKAETIANTIKIKAEAKAKEYEVEAEGQRKLNEAENVLAKDILEYRTKIETINKTPEIVEKMVKPMEKISDIKILQTGGTFGNTDNNTTITGNNMFNGLLNTALQYKMYIPFVENILKEVNLDEKSLKDKFLQVNLEDKKIGKNNEKEYSKKFNNNAKHEQEQNNKDIKQEQNNDNAIKKEKTEGNK